MSDLPGLKVRTARVGGAWVAHKENSEQEAVAFESARRMAMSAAIKDRRHGLEAAKVNVVIGTSNGRSGGDFREVVLVQSRIVR